MNDVWHFLFDKFFYLPNVLWKNMIFFYLFSNKKKSLEQILSFYYWLIHFISFHSLGDYGVIHQVIIMDLYELLFGTFQKKKKWFFFHHYYLYMVWCVAWWLMMLMMMMITVDYGLRNRFIHSILVKKIVSKYTFCLCVCVYMCVWWMIKRGVALIAWFGLLFVFNTPVVVVFLEKIKDILTILYLMIEGVYTWLLFFFFYCQVRKDWKKIHYMVVVWCGVVGSFVCVCILFSFRLFIIWCDNHLIWSKIKMIHFFLGILLYLCMCVHWGSWFND